MSNNKILAEVPQVIAWAEWKSRKSFKYSIILPPAQQRISLLAGNGRKGNWLVEVPWTIAVVGVTPYQSEVLVKTCALAALWEPPTAANIRTQKIYHMGLPNIHDSCSVCAGSSPIMTPQNTSLSSALILGINSFWQSSGNYDLSHGANLTQRFKKWEESPKPYLEHRKEIFNAYNLSVKSLTSLIDFPLQEGRVDYSMPSYESRFFQEPKSIFHPDYMIPGSAMTLAGMMVVKPS